MPYSPGNLWHRAEVLEKVLGEDAHGGPKPTYPSVVATRRCRFVPASGSESFRAGTVDAINEATLEMAFVDIDSNKHCIRLTDCTSSASTTYEVVWSEHVNDRGRKTRVHVKQGTQ